LKVLSNRSNTSILLPSLWAKEGTQKFQKFMFSAPYRQALHSTVTGIVLTSFSPISYKMVVWFPEITVIRCCATNRKVADSIPAGVSGFVLDIKFFRSHYGPGVHSASNRNEYQEHFLGVKAAGA